MLAPLLLLACAPKDNLGAPLPETYALEATHYRSDTLPRAQLAPLEGALVDQLESFALAAGQSFRVDAAMTDVARTLAWRHAVDGLEPGVVEVRQVGLALGAPTADGDPGVLHLRRGEADASPLQEQLLSQGGRVAVGVGAWDDKANRRSVAVVVFSRDLLTLDAPVPMDSPTALNGTFHGQGVLGVVADPGYEWLDVEGPELGLDVGTETTRIDVSGAREEVRDVAWFDFKGAPPTPPLSEGADDAERLVAALNQGREALGLPPLAFAGRAPACEGFPRELDGQPLAKRQSCFLHQQDGGFEEVWRLYGGRPTLVYTMQIPDVDLVTVDENLSFHVLKRFRVMDEAEGRAALEAEAESLWPGVVIDRRSQEALTAAARLFADATDEESYARGKAVLEGIEQPFSDLYPQWQRVSIKSNHWNEVMGYIEGDGPCLRAAFGYARGEDADGWPVHGVSMICIEGG